LLGALLSGAVLTVARSADMPDDGLLEFLGSVDSEDKDWHDYLARTDIDKVARRAANGANSPPCATVPPAWRSAPGRLRPTGRDAMTARSALYAVLLMVCLPALAAEPTAAPAAPPPGGVAWSSMSAPQQQALGHFQEQWGSLPPERQQALATGAQRWLSMTPAQRGEARERFQTWQRLPPEQRALIRQHWQRFQQLPPEQQQAVRQNFRAFSRLPPAQRAQLRERWLNATPQQRSQMLQRQRAQRLERNGQHAPPDRNR
jgi:hypothetical protein